MAREAFAGNSVFRAVAEDTLKLVIHEIVEQDDHVFGIDHAPGLLVDKLNHFIHTKCRR